MMHKMFRCIWKKQKTYETPTTSEIENAKKYVPPITSGFVIKVYDGDTITVMSKLHNTWYTFSVRLAGIDCPEIRGKSAHEREMALAAKNKISKLVLLNHVELKNVTTEKYGRILADVYCDGIHINKLMLDCGLSVAYSGGAKPEW